MGFMQFFWRRRTTSPDIIQRSYTTPDGTNRSLAKFYPRFWCGIEGFRTSSTSTSLTISSTYSSQMRSLRWTSSKRKIMEVIEVDQLEDINNERLSWAMPHSRLRVEYKNKKITNKKIRPPKDLVLPPLPHMYSGRMCRFAPFLK